MLSDDIVMVYFHSQRATRLKIDARTEGIAVTLKQYDPVLRRWRLFENFLQLNTLRTVSFLSPLIMARRYGQKYFTLNIILLCASITHFDETKTYLE